MEKKCPNTHPHPHTQSEKERNLYAKKSWVCQLKKALPIRELLKLKQLRNIHRGNKLVLNKIHILIFLEDYFWNHYKKTLLPAPWIPHGFYTFAHFLHIYIFVLHIYTFVLLIYTFVLQIYTLFTHLPIWHSHICFTHLHICFTHLHISFTHLQISFTYLHIFYTFTHLFYSFTHLFYIPHYRNNYLVFNNCHFLIKCLDQFSLINELQLMTCQVF